MIVENKNLTMVRGDTENLYITVKNYEYHSGDSVKLTVRDYQKAFTGKLVAGDNVQFTKTGTIANGICTIKILPTDTKTLAADTYCYDIQLTTSGGDIHTIVPIHYFTLVSEVTK